MLLKHEGQLGGSRTRKRKKMLPTEETLTVDVTVRSLVTAEFKLHFGKSASAVNPET